MTPNLLLRKWALILFTVCLALLVAVPWHSGKNHSTVPAVQAGFFDSDLDIFSQVLDKVADEYVYAPDFKNLFGSAIQGMIEKVGDKGLIAEDIVSGKVLKSGGGSISYRLNFSRPENFEALQSVYNFLSKQFAGKIKKKDLEVAAIEGMMSSLDPYSMYMNVEDFERSMRDTEGQYGGVGMVITMRDLKLVVVRTVKGSPAERAGILPDDVITGVNGQVIKEMQIGDLANKLRGYPNTEVQMEVYRPSTDTRTTHTLIREIISVETVEYKNLGNHTGYLKLSGFSKQTNNQLEIALEQAVKEDINAFILDLRGNPGGLLSQSVQVASHFLNKGELIVYTRARDRNEMQTYEAQFKQTLTHLPLVVLIDNHSASASEIVAGSLKDSGKALILGENSYGKGSVQTIFRMSDGSGLRLTTSKYYTPSGIDISTHGIAPEIVIEKDLPPDQKGSEQNKINKPLKLGKGLQMTTQFKESELKAYLKKNGVAFDKDLDPWVAFAQLVVQNAKHPSKSHALARARELAKDIHY